tara:strand:+ start:1198 stop:2211 length:1014 start_codon:yes stop_codon:yes gene_type:complete
MKISKRLKSYSEFVNESKKKDRRIQFIKVDPIKSSTDNDTMKDLTEKSRDRFFEVFLEEDYGDILELSKDIDLDRPMLVYAGSKDPNTEKFVMEVYNKKSEMVYNLPKEMKKAGSKVEFHKIFEGEEFVPKTVFNLDEAEKLTWPVIAKPAEGHSGIGIEKFKKFEDLKISKNKFDLYSECINFDREFRVLCVKDKPIILYERQLIESDNKSIETKKPDEQVSFVYIDQDMEKSGLMKGLNEIIEKFMKKIPLGVYSLDFFTENETGNIKIIEANSCSGLGANSLVHVYESLYEDFYGEELPRDDAEFVANIKKGYRKVVFEDYPNEYKKSLSPKDI